MISKTIFTVDTERLQRVKRNRQVQLQRWNYYEKEFQKSISNDGKSSYSTNNVRKRRIEFGKDIILLEAVSRNDINEVVELLNEGVNPNVSTVDGLTGLHQCCIDDFLEMAKILIQFNADVNAKDSEKWTPLHAAATCDNSQMCLLLSKHGCDFLALNSDGNMPYDICEGNKALKVIESEMAKKGITQQQIDDARMIPEQRMLREVKVYVQQKGDLDFLDSQGAAMIHIACSLGYSEVVQTLLDAGAKYSLPDKDGWLPIHLAACWSHVDIVEILAVFGADISLTNVSGDTIFDLCEPDLRERLLYIKNNISEIRKSSNLNRMPPYKGFRRSRGSSVRRTSVRQKNIISKKEAKEEYIALNQAISSTDEKRSIEIDPLTNIPTTIDECIDIDSTDLNPQTLRITVPSIKAENSTTKQTTSNSKKIISSISNTTSVNDRPTEIPTVRFDMTSSVLPSQSNVGSQPPIKSSNNNNNSPKSEIKTRFIQCEDRVDSITKKSSINRESNSKVEAIDKPKYVFKSNTERWDVANEHKIRHKRKCCLLI